MSTSTEVASTSTVRVTLDGDRVRLHLGTDAPEGAPRIRPILLSSDATSARVALVPDGALLLAGDRIRIDVEVGPGALLELVEPGGTVAYDMEGGSAHWDVSVAVSAGAALLWHGEPFVISQGARVRRTTQLLVASDARVVLREVLVLGRHGESPGALDQRTVVSDERGAPLLVERLDVDSTTWVELLGGRRVMASVTVFGMAAVETEPGPREPVRFDLECGGQLYRTCVDAAHEAADDRVWDQVARAIRSRTANSIPTASAR